MSTVIKTTYSGLTENETTLATDVINTSETSIKEYLATVYTEETLENIVYQGKNATVTEGEQTILYRFTNTS